MDQNPYSMDAPRREVVLQSVVERCAGNHHLLAAHVRTRHVHIVVDSRSKPERIMNDLKSFASRRLNEAGLDVPTRKRWARHGSTKWLKTRKAILAAITYVIEKQGTPMSSFESDRSLWSRLTEEARP